MFQFLILILLVSSFLSCQMISKSGNSIRKTANKKVEPFEFKTVKTEWLKVYPEIYKELIGIIEFERKEIKNQAEEFQKSFPNSKFFPFKLAIENLTEFNKENPDIASFRMTFYTFTGGVHGMVQHISWNWDKKEKKFLSLNDYVKTDSQFKKLKADIKKAVLEALEPSYKETSWIEGELSDLQDIGVWNISGDNLILTFPPYQLAPYAAGSIEVSVPKP